MKIYRNRIRQQRQYNKQESQNYNNILLFLSTILSQITYIIITIRTIIIIINPLSSFGITNNNNNNYYYYYYNTIVTVTAFTPYPVPLSEELGCSPTLTKLISGIEREQQQTVGGGGGGGLDDIDNPNNDNNNNNNNGELLYFFDPLQLATDENFARYREAELKHGRIAMLAVIGTYAPSIQKFGLLPTISYATKTTIKTITNTISTIMTTIATATTTTTTTTTIPPPTIKTLPTKPIDVITPTQTDIMTTVTTKIPVATATPADVVSNAVNVVAPAAMISGESSSSSSINIGNGGGGGTILNAVLTKSIDTSTTQSISTTSSSISSIDNIINDETTFPPFLLLSNLQHVTLIDIGIIIIVCGILETTVFIQRNPLDMPGDYSIGYFGMRNKGKHERSLISELENGRLAMMSMLLLLIIDILQLLFGTTNIMASTTTTTTTTSTNTIVEDSFQNLLQLFQ